MDWKLSFIQIMPNSEITSYIRNHNGNKKEEMVINQAYVKCFDLGRNKKLNWQYEVRFKHQGDRLNSPDPSRSGWDTLLVLPHLPLHFFVLLLLHLFFLRLLLSSLSSHLIGPFLCSLSPSSCCPSVSPHLWSNDSQLSTPHRLPWPPSRPDSSTDEIAHWTSLWAEPGQSYFRWWLFCFYLFISLLFCHGCLWCVCVYVCLFTCVCLILPCFLGVFSLLTILIQKEKYISDNFSPWCLLGTLRQIII